MNSEWLDSEIDACVRTYLWMRDTAEKGYKPTKKRVREALIDGPMANRSHGSIEYRFQDISAVLADRGDAWIEGYKPAGNVGAKTTTKIEHFIKKFGKERHARRLNWLVNAIPGDVVKRAVSELAAGQDFQYSDSTDYDLIFDGNALPPKKVIGYAGLLYFGAPFFSDNFSGGENTPCFKRLISSGFEIESKSDSSQTDTEDPQFRDKVKQHKSAGAKIPPKGKGKPQKRIVSSVVYYRDSKVVAFVEERAQGTCELCGVPSPFNRPDGTPFLEVHHIIPLAEEGADTAENAAALCPNCHRACHHGTNAGSHRLALEAKISNK